VLIELEGEGVDLALELAQAVGQPIALLPERLGERHHRLDEPALAVLGGEQGVAHGWFLDTRLRPRSKSDAGMHPPGTSTWRAGASSA
jgi:hypothetical protein